MNDHELDLALTDFGATRVQPTAPPMLRQRIGTMPLPSNTKRGFLPRIPQWRFQSMFSATKFVVAGVIVALFGGFLLAGVLTQQPSERAVAPASSPTATWAPPSELAIEELAPGVMKATLAGVGSIERSGSKHDFTFDQHGDMWMLSPDGLRRVGDETSYPGPGSTDAYWDLTSAPDGALWAVANGTVASFRDDVWTDAPEFPGKPPASALEVLPDGTVWARSTTRLARLDGDTWTAYRITDEYGPISDSTYIFPGDLAWTLDGSLWVTTCYDYHDDDRGLVRSKDRGGLVRFDGTAFHPAAPPRPLDGCRVSPLASGTDGELWAYLAAELSTLARFDGTDWELSDDPVGIPRIHNPWMVVGFMVVAPDGRLWATGDFGRVLGAFDGTTWTDASVPREERLGSTGSVSNLLERPLRVAPDGSIWVWTLDGYFLVITPEALAATE